MPTENFPEEKDDGYHQKWLIKVLHEIAEFTAIAHVSKIHLPKTLNWLGKFSIMGAEILHHPELPMVENTVCNGGLKLLKEMIDVASAAAIARWLGMSVIASENTSLVFYRKFQMVPFHKTCDSNRPWVTVL